MANSDYKTWIDSKEGNFPYYNPAKLKFGPIYENGKLYYKVLTQESFPIVAAGLLYDSGDDKILPKEAFDLLSECGFNVELYHSLSKKYIPHSILNGIDAAVTLMCFTSSFFLTTELNATGVLSTVEPQNFKGFGGVKLFDEPTYFQLIGKDSWNKSIHTGLKDGYLQDHYRDLMSQDVKTLAYINLSAQGNDFLKNNPNDPDSQVTFEEFLQTYQDYFKPSFFCYDLYPIRERSDLIYTGVFKGGNFKPYNIKEGEIIWDPIDSDTFYGRLNLFATFSKKYDRPFWAFCDCQSYISLDRYIYRPLALEQFLRYEAFSALAYGAQGLVYWSYPISKTVPGEQSNLVAPLNRRDAPTAVWHYVQKINREIKKYENVFFNGQVIGTKNLVQDSKVQKKLVINKKPRYQLGISTDSDESLVISEIIDNKNRTNFMIVNRSPLVYQNLIFNVGMGKIRELTPVVSNSTGNTLLEEGDNPRILPPGGYRILRIES